MKFEEVLPALRAGKKVRRKCWSAGLLPTNDILADDWEIVKEKVWKTLWVNVSQVSNGFVPDGIFESEEVAMFSARRCGVKRIGTYPVTVEVEE